MLPQTFCIPLCCRPPPVLCFRTLPPLPTPTPTAFPSARLAPIYCPSGLNRIPGNPVGGEGGPPWWLGGSTRPRQPPGPTLPSCLTPRWFIMCRPLAEASTGCRPPPPPLPPELPNPRPQMLLLAARGAPPSMSTLAVGGWCENVRARTAIPRLGLWATLPPRQWAPDDKPWQGWQPTPHNPHPQTSSGGPSARTACS